MIKVYGLEACPDCQDVKNQIKERMDEFAYFDLASETKLMKEYLSLRDNNELFVPIKEEGKIGVPYFIFEDGTISFDPEDAGLIKNSRVACSLADHKNGVKGC